MHSDLGKNDIFACHQIHSLPQIVMNIQLLIDYALPLQFDQYKIYLFLSTKSKGIKQNNRCWKYAGLTLYFTIAYSELLPRNFFSQHFHIIL